MPLQKNQSIVLNIESLASDASGIGRHEGMVVFVPHTAAGDAVRVRIEKVNKTHAFARVLEVLQAGEGRCAPACEAYPQCGGCSLWHLEYEAELRAKQGFVEDALRRIGGFDTGVEPILPSPQVLRYRNKVQLPVQTDATGRLIFGFYAGRSHRVVPCRDCLLQPEEMNQIAACALELAQENGTTSYDEGTHRGVLRHLYLRRSDLTGDVLVCFVVNAKNFPAGAKIAVELAARYPSVKTVLANHNTAQTNVILGRHNTLLLGTGTIRDTLCGVPVELGPMSFFQVNNAAAAGLFQTVARYAQVEPQHTLLDLYCGAGVIGLSMAHGAKQLIGVEIVPQAIETASASAQAMGLANTRFICADAGTAARTLQQEGVHPDVITVDPPRKGCDETTLRAMADMAPERIVMVSCNSATLARDLKWLCANGYSIQRVQPADLFPRTRHVECAALLVRGTHP